MIHELCWKNLQDRKTDIRLNYAIQNYEIVNVPNKEILIPAATRTRSKLGHKYPIMINSTNEYKYSLFPSTIS